METQIAQAFCECFQPPVEAAKLIMPHDIPSYTPTRLILFGIMIVMVVGAIFLWSWPVTEFWIMLLDRLILYKWWYWIFLIISFIFYAVGKYNYQMHGMPQFFPWISGAFAATWLFLNFVLVCNTAVDWSFYDILMMLAVNLFGMIFLLIPAVVNYTEIWHRDEQKIITRVQDSLSRNKFREQWQGNPWGSRHCLEIAQMHYEQTRQAINPDFKYLINPTDGEEQLKNKFIANIRAGKDLLFFLNECQWPERLLAKKDIAKLTCDLLRELTTIALMGKRYYPLDGKEWEQEVRDWLAQLPSKTPGWLLWRQIIQFALENNCAAHVDLHKATQAAGKILNSFAGLTAKEQNIFAYTWLAVFPSDAGLPPELGFEVWLKIRIIQKAESLFVNLESSTPPTLEAVAAQFFLLRWYREWADEIADPTWNALIKGRAEYAEKLAEKF